MTGVVERRRGRLGYPLFGRWLILWGWLRRLSTAPAHTSAAPGPPPAVMPGVEWISRARAPRTTVEDLPPVDFGLGDPFETPAPAARRVVGVCGACGGPLVIVPFGFVEHGASCPCARMAIPAAFVRAGMTTTGETAT